LHVAGLALVGLAAVIGCSGEPWLNPPPEVLGHTWYNSRSSPDEYPDPDQTTAAGLDAAFHNTPVQTPPPARSETRPLNVLVLSGGGKYGAYMTGVLSGWTANGTRPQFDVVTGISSGALLSVYAFLGPEYDEQAARNFTTTRRRDLYRVRPFRYPLTIGAVASTKPFAELLEREVNDEVVAEIAAAHCQGRRLFIATGNRTTFRPAIWDLGAIAASGRPGAADLVRKILLASASHPGFTPGVELDVTVNGVHYREIHGDAGNLIQAFVQTANGLPAGSNVYVMTAGKWEHDPATERPGLIPTVIAATSATLYALYRADVSKVYALCAVSRSRFHLVNMPPEHKVEPGSLNFDEEQLEKLFQTGLAQAAGGIPWRTNLPGTQPGETQMPRTGLEFVVPE
jgi:hypothetical protein